MDDDRSPRLPQPSQVSFVLACHRCGGCPPSMPFPEDAIITYLFPNQFALYRCPNTTVPTRDFPIASTKSAILFLSSVLRTHLRPICGVSESPSTLWEYFHCPLRPSHTHHLLPPLHFTNTPNWAGPHTDRGPVQSAPRVTRRRRRLPSSSSPPHTPTPSHYPHPPANHTPPRHSHLLCPVQPTTTTTPHSPHSSSPPDPAPWQYSSASPPPPPSLPPAATDRSTPASRTASRFLLLPLSRPSRCEPGSDDTPSANSPGIR